MQSLRKKLRLNGEMRSLKKDPSFSVVFSCLPRLKVSLKNLQFFVNP